MSFFPQWSKMCTCLASLNGVLYTVHLQFPHHFGPGFPSVFAKGRCVHVSTTIGTCTKTGLWTVWGSRGPWSHCLRTRMCPLPRVSTLVHLPTFSIPCWSIFENDWFGRPCQVIPQNVFPINSLVFCTVWQFVENPNNLLETTQATLVMLSSLN